MVTLNTLLIGKTTVLNYKIPFTPQEIESGHITLCWIAYLKNRLYGVKSLQENHVSVILPKDFFLMMPQVFVHLMKVQKNF
ncbi:hypothetical protein EE490_22355 [Salmonella enterica]|nr:hypothetical protein [Salmonella enterica]EAM5485494.1 hypothetical protein [Salmonella enterica]EAN0353318.1 hypothetical protein [Salmonella enterica]EAN5818041.1 hypothetical protein [Salmonella enterica]EAP1077730.1 hypothetical protein [Salmonella enterica]